MDSRLRAVNDFAWSLADRAVSTSVAMKAMITRNPVGTIASVLLWHAPSTPCDSPSIVFLRG